MKQYAAELYKKNRAEILERNREWAKKNPEKQRARTKRWREANVLKCRLYCRKYETRRADAPGNPTAVEVEARMSMFGFRCAYCAGPFDHIDHVIPLSRGGTNYLANLRPSCASCNSSKNDRTPKEWRQR